MKVILKASIDVKERRLNSWLRTAKEYIVLAVEQHSGGVTGYRIASEDGEQPVVFEAALFDVSDGHLPSSWVVMSLQGATLELGPAEFGRAGFWEEVFDREPEALEVYQATKERILVESQ